MSSAIPHQAGLLLRLHCRTTSLNSESRLPFGRRAQQRTKRRHCSCVEMSICLRVMMIISCKLSGPHHKFRLRARRAQLPQLPHSRRRGPASRDTTAFCFPSTQYSCECLGASRLKIMG